MITETCKETNRKKDNHTHVCTHARTDGQKQKKRKKDWKTDKRMKSWKATKAVNNESYCEFTMPKTYFATAFDRIPILLSLGGIDECPAEVCTLSSSVM